LSSGANRFFFYNGLYGVGVVNGNVGGNVIPQILNPSQQLGNIYYIYSSNGPSSIVITPVLNHSNYHVWAHSMRKAHGGKNKFDLVDGSILVHWSLIQVSRLGIVATCLCIFGL
jgi:activator of HSP90 ATPase